jgi:hypothetical protein
LIKRHVSSGSPLEPEIGFSRAVRVGAHIAVAGTAPIPTPDRARTNGRFRRFPAIKLPPRRMTRFAPFQPFPDREANRQAGWASVLR